MFCVPGWWKELMASWRGQATVTHSLKQGLGAQLLLSGSQAHVWSCPAAPLALPVQSRERQGRCVWVGRGVWPRAPRQASLHTMN